MNIKIIKIVEQIKHVRNSVNPVVESWIMACKNIGLSQDDPMVTFGLMFANHPDLISSNKDYHNQNHAADAVITASILAKEEFSKKDLSKNGAILIFSMLCHDLNHNGKGNTYEYELEKKSILSMNSFIKQDESFQYFWKRSMIGKYDSLDVFLKYVEEIILGTDFKVGYKENCKGYNNLSQDEIKISQLKMLANESDILPSCLSSFGPDLGKKLAKEQNDVNVGSWLGRKFFLEKLAIFSSKASKEIGILEHISRQLKSIDKYGALKLDELSNNNFNKISNMINKESIKENKSMFNFELIEKLRDIFLDVGLSGTNTNKK